MNKNTESQAALAESVEHGTASRMAPGLSLGQSFLSLVKTWELLRVANESGKERRNL